MRTHRTKLNRRLALKHKKHYRIQELADAFEIPARTLYDSVYSGRIKALRLGLEGGALYVAPSEVKRVFGRLPDESEQEKTDDPERAA
jgi:hypothetical protein